MFRATIHPDNENGTSDPVEDPLDSDQDINIYREGVSLVWNIHFTPRRLSRANPQENKGDTTFV